MNKTKLITGGTIGLTFLLNSGISLATDTCTISTSCEDLGYTETSCEGNSIKCPFDTSKMYCGYVAPLNGIIDGNCYENDELVGVQIGDTSYCISLEEAYYGSPNSKWKNGETAFDQDTDESIYYFSTNAKTTTTSQTYASYGNYSWGYLMGFNKNCYYEDCGNSGYKVSEEQDGSWCKTVMGSNWRAPTCLSGSKDDNCELYSLIYLNAGDTSTAGTINYRLNDASSGNTITPSSRYYYWSSSEYSNTSACSVGTTSGDISYGVKYSYTLRLRCVREF
ncbi:MAG: hypothetical protein R3Y43_00490 [Alphaproteobacteria bacterium]